MSDYDFIIVGAGIMGCALAAGLSSRGWSVLVVERDLSEPDRIVGELLQPGGIQALQKLGLEDAIEGIDSIPTYGYEVIYRGNGVNIPYPKPFTGRGFHHGKFIQQLRQLSGEKGAKFLEATVTNVIHDPYGGADGSVLGVKATIKSTGKTVELIAPVTIMCDGISSKFRKSFTTEKPLVKSHFVGFILKDAVLPRPAHGHVIIGQGHQPILIYQIGEHETRILCDILGPLPSMANDGMKDFLVDKVRTHLPECVLKSFDDALDTQKYRVMPAQYLPATKNTTNGLILVGDAMNMRHPLTGGGMTVAFKDAVLLSELLDKKKLESQSLSLSDPFAVKKLMAEFYARRRLEGAAVINILAMALYELFAAKGTNLEILQRGCFKYFERGGECIDQPVKLLSGINSSVVNLFYNFFAVAFCAIAMNFRDKGLVGFPVALIQVFTVLYTASMVFLPIMYRETRWW